MGPRNDDQASRFTALCVLVSCRDPKMPPNWQRAKSLSLIQGLLNRIWRKKRVRGRKNECGWGHPTGKESEAIGMLLNEVV